MLCEPQTDQRQEAMKVLLEAPLLSVIVPIYNEADSIQEVFRRLQDLSIAKEIILVDDGSLDGTRRILESLEESDGLPVVFQPNNRGKGAAIRAGLAVARGEFVIIQDADREYNPDDIPAIFEPLIEKKADAVYGSRFHQTGSASSRLSLHWLANRFLTGLSNILNGQRLSDMETGYKAMRRELMQGLNLKEDRFGIEPELAAKLARRKIAILEVPISYCPRSYAEGKKIGPLDALRAIYSAVRYRFFS
jgi:glycosyltransferase involved in cell wall biosynthesis